MLGSLLALGLDEASILQLSRVAAFAIVGAFLPLPLVPSIARIALVALLTLVTLPTSPALPDLGAFLVTVSAPPADAPRSALLLSRFTPEIAVGVLSGVVLGTAFYSVALLSRWARASLLPGEEPPSGTGTPIETGIWCLYLVGFAFAFEGFVDAAAETLTIPIGPQSLGGGDAALMSSTVLRTLVPALGSLFFSTAALLALPLLGISLIIETLAILGRRTVGPFIGDPSVSAMRMLALVLVLGWISLDVEMAVQEIYEALSHVSAAEAVRDSLGLLMPR